MKVPILVYNRGRVKCVEIANFFAMTLQGLQKLDEEIKSTPTAKKPAELVISKLHAPSCSSVFHPFAFLPLLYRRLCQMHYCW